MEANQNLQNQTDKRPVFRRPAVWFAVLGIVLLAAAVWIAQLKASNKKLQDQAKDPGMAAKAQSTELISQVGKLIVLPPDEEPTLATITDLDKLKEQPFFANAELGDKVLIYSAAKKAILYRPSENKIIEVAPFTTFPSSGSASSTVP